MFLYIFIYFIHHNNNEKNLKINNKIKYNI